MRAWRSIVVAIAAVALAVTPVARATDPAVVAKAGFGIVGDARHGYAVFFTVRQAFTGAVSRLDMISEVFDCSFDTGDCPMVRDVRRPVVVARDVRALPLPPDRAVVRLPQDVGVAGVPREVIADVHHDPAQRDVLPTRGPPRTCPGVGKVRPNVGPK